MRQLTHIHLIFLYSFVSYFTFVGFGAGFSRAYRGLAGSKC